MNLKYLTVNFQKLKRSNKENKLKFSARTPIYKVTATQLEYDMKNIRDQKPTLVAAIVVMKGFTGAGTKNSEKRLEQSWKRYTRTWGPRRG